MIALGTAPAPCGCGALAQNAEEAKSPSLAALGFLAGTVVLGSLLLMNPHGVTRTVEKHPVLVASTSAAMLALFIKMRTQP